jgi:hydroxyquinol 1,2-dioxygenase
VTTPGLSVSQRRSANEITHEVIASFSKCSDARLRELLQSLVTHLHAFAREVRLTPQEWARAMEVLAETGRLTDENRQEFILWSDTFGLSTAVDALDDRRDPRATESTVEGPFRAYGSPRREYGESIAEQPGGVPLWLHGRVLDVHGTPIAAAELDVWQNGPDRLYSVQDPHAPQGHLRGIFRTRQDGTYALLGIRPTPYSIPQDGPVGAMLRATGRQSWRPAHVHLAVSAPGFEPVVTHVFDDESEFLDSDAVFAVKPSLIRKFERRGANDPQRPPGVDGPWCLLEMDVVLDVARAPNDR